MKPILYNLLFCFVLALASANCFSQKKICGTFLLSQQNLEDSCAVHQEILFEEPETPAEFPDGRDSLRRFLSENLKYPSTGICASGCISGKCWVRLTIEEDGTISKVSVIRGVQDCPECDAEAVRVVKLMPKWIPGKLIEKPVKSYFDLPINFSISN